MFFTDDADSHVRLAIAAQQPAAFAVNVARVEFLSRRSQS
jgi:hypothetical protein